MSTPSSVQAWRLPADQATWDNHRSIQLRDVKLSPPGKGEDILIPKKLYPGPYSSGPDGEGHILASDGAGQVVAVGQGVTDWSHGDRVVGSFTEAWLSGELKHEVFPAEALVRIPSYLTYEEAATLPCAAVTAWACLFETAVAQPVGPHSTVLVQGSGGVSMFGAQLAKATGARVIATTSSAEKVEKYKTIVGVDEVVNYRETPEWSEEVRKLTGGNGVEHILEVGGQTTLSQSFKAIQVGGHIYILGMVGGINGTGIDFGEFSTAMILNRLNLHGQAVGSTEMFRKLMGFMEKHQIKPVVGKVFEWEQAVEALDYMADGAHFGKVVIKIQ